MQTWWILGVKRREWKKGSKAFTDNKFQSLITSINKMWKFGFRILIEIVSIWFSTFGSQQTILTGTNNITIAPNLNFVRRWEIVEHFVAVHKGLDILLLSLSLRRLIDLSLLFWFTLKVFDNVFSIGVGSF